MYLNVLITEKIKDNEEYKMKKERALSYMIVNDCYGSIIRT